MSESHQQVQNSYPRGSGTASVPILFSLRNVQPSLVKGAAKESAIVGGPASEPNPPAPAFASDRTVATKPSLIAKVPKPGNRIYNGTIALLVVILCVIVFRNLQLKGTTGLSPVLANANKPIVDNKKTAPITIAPIALTATSTSPFALGPTASKESPLASSGTASVSMLNPRPEPNSESGFPISKESNLAVATSTSPLLLPSSNEVDPKTPPTLPPLPRRDSSPSLMLGNPELNEPFGLSPNATLTSASKPRTEGLDLPQPGDVQLSPVSNSTTSVSPSFDPPLARPTSTSPTAGSQPTAPTKVESVVDTGMELTTKELIAAFQAGPISSTNPTLAPSQPLSQVPYSVNSGGATSAPYVGSSTVPARSVSYTPILEPAATTRPYTPISQPQQPIVAYPITNIAPNNIHSDVRDAMAQATLNTNSQLMAGQAYPPLPKEAQPIAVQNNMTLAIPAYEQYAMDPNKNIPLHAPTTPRQPSDPNANRYQGTTIQQPTPKTTYTPMYPSQGSVPSGTPIGYPPK